MEIREITKDKLYALEPGFNQQTVQLLEQLLEQAKRGELQQLYAVYQYEGGNFGHAWTGSDNVIELVGWLELMKSIQVSRMRRK